MRSSLAVLAGTFATFVATSASAAPLCDPNGHFCIDVDTVGAVTCDLLRPGPEALDPKTCMPEDAAVRDQLRAAQWPVLGAMMLRFGNGDASALIELAKRGPTPDLSNADVAAHAEKVRAMAAAKRRLDAFAAPQVSRVHGAQVLRLDVSWTEGTRHLEDIALEVHAGTGTYAIDINGTAGPQLTALADKVLATLDTTPASPPNPWFARVCAVVGAGFGYGLVRLLRNRKKRPIEPASLWPRG